MSGRKMILTGLIVAAGLYDFAGATSFVRGLEENQIDSMITVLSNEGLQPAYRVASITEPIDLRLDAVPGLPDGLDMDAIFLEPNQDDELVIKGINPNGLSPNQFRQMEDRIRKLVIKMKTEIS